MFKYVGLAWSAESEEQSRVAESFIHRIEADDRGWGLAHAASGMRVYCAGLHPGSIEIYRLADDAGVVLGTVFRAISQDSDETSKAVFGVRETREIRQTRGRALTQQYWGRYVAFITEPTQRTVRILRSPTGEIDCLRTCLRGVHVYFSRTEDCPLLDAHDAEVDWDFIAAQLSTTLPETRQTGLRQVQRVLCGECVEVCGGESRRCTYWSPLSFINSRPLLEDPARTTVELRRTVRACVAAWSGCHRSILALLSGGFDSSVVVSVLPDAPESARVTCVNYRNQFDSTSDERRYARAVANHRRYDLIEYENSEEIALDPLLRLGSRLPSCQPIFAFPETGWRRELARSRGATGCMTGEGGDQLFFQNGAYYVCADFIYTHGVRPRALSVALDAARIEGGAMWPALRIGLRDARRADPVTAVTDNHRFSAMLGADVTERVQQQRLYVPEFLRTGERAPPGKCWQAIGLSLHAEMYGAHAQEGDPEFLNPLTSQPLQELCFQIPTYVLTIGGQSRGLARRAFMNDAPAGVLNRRTKAFGYDSMKELIAKNRPILRSLLLDGLLARERIIDAGKLERVLSGDLTKGIGTAPDVIHAVSTEVWLQNWHRSRASMAA